MLPTGSVYLDLSMSFDDGPRPQRPPGPSPSAATPRKSRRQADVTASQRSPASRSLFAAAALRLQQMTRARLARNLHGLFARVVALARENAWLRARLAGDPALRAEAARREAASLALQRFARCRAATTKVAELRRFAALLSEREALLSAIQLELEASESQSAAVTPRSSYDGDAEPFLLPPLQISVSESLQRPPSLS